MEWMRMYIYIYGIERIKYMQIVLRLCFLEPNRSVLKMGHVFFHILPAAFSRILSPASFLFLEYQKIEAEPPALGVGQDVFTPVSVDMNQPLAKSHGCQVQIPSHRNS